MQQKGRNYDVFSMSKKDDTTQKIKTEDTNDESGAIGNRITRILLLL